MSSDGPGPEQGADIAIVYTLYADLRTAEHAVADVVKAGLAACANILSPSCSSYIWNGVYETQTEYPVLFKTGQNRRAELIARLSELHPYEVPAILSWDAAAAASYAAWVSSMTTAP